MGRASYTYVSAHDDAQGLKEKTIMKTRLMMSGLLVLGMSAFAAGKTHKVDIQQDSVIEGKMVKAGEYKISFENGNALLQMGKESIQVPAHEVTNANKVYSDELTYVDNNKLQAINIAGTTTKIVFEPAGTMQSGS